MNHRRRAIRRLRDVLRRRNILKSRRNTNNDEPQTRITMAMWIRPNTIVHPEKDLSEWVYKVAKRDWQAVVKGHNRK